MVSPVSSGGRLAHDLPRLRQVRARGQDLRARAAARRRARGRPAHARLGRGRLRSDRRVADRADDPLRDGAGGRGERRSRRGRGRARTPGRRRRRAGPARPGRSPAPRAPAARVDHATGRRQALLSEDPRLVDESPPGLEGPGVRERFARLAIDLTPIREAPAFRWFWLGQAAKDLGSGVAQVALPYQIYQLTGSTLAVAAISFVELVPLVTLTLLGGALADAVDRRRLLLWTQIGMAATGVGLVVNAAIAEPQV